MKFLSRSAFFLVSLVLFPLALLTQAQAEDARVLTWADLVPATAVTENPFLELSRDQLTWISDVAAVSGVAVKPGIAGFASVIPLGTAGRQPATQASRRPRYKRRKRSPKSLSRPESMWMACWHNAR